MTSGARTPIMLVVPDGMGDRPQPALDGLTPLEAAATPNLNTLATLGRSGLMYPIEPGLAASSHQAHFALFSYAPAEFPGRGVLEAFGEGLPPAPDEVVLRANLARVSERDGVLWIDERPDPRTGEADLAGAELNCTLDGVACRFVHTGALQGLLYLRPLDGALSHFVSDADPLAAGGPVLAVQPLDEAPDAGAAARTAAVLNAWIRRSRDVLAGRPLDCMLVKWAGARANLTPFALRTGLRGVSLGAGPLYAGLAAALEMDHAELPVERDAEADVRVRLEKAMELLGQGYDFIHLHTKWPDHAGHRKDPARKRDVIEAVDRALAPLAPLVERGELVVIAAPDHQTPSSGPLYHSGGPVPFIIAGGVIGTDGVTEYSERRAVKGSLGVLRGRDLLPLALDAADRSAFLADRMTGHLALGAPRPEDLRPLLARE